MFSLRIALFAGLLSLASARAHAADPTAPAPSPSASPAASPATRVVADDSPRAMLQRWLDLAREGEHEEAATMMELPVEDGARGA